MSATLPTSAILRAFVEKAIAELISNGQPGRVESYDALQRRADVQPVILEGRIDRASGERVVERQPVVTSVPVIFPGTHRAGMSVDVQPGDVVWLLSARSSLDRFLLQGGEVDPEDDRRNDPNDAVAIVGLFDFANAIPGSDDGLVLHGDRIRHGGLDASDPVVRKSDLDTVVARLNAVIDRLEGHTHGGVTSGAGSTLVPNGSLHAPVNTQTTTLTSPSCSATTFTK